MLRPELTFLRRYSSPLLASSFESLNLTTSAFGWHSRQNTMSRSSLSYQRISYRDSFLWYLHPMRRQLTTRPTNGLTPGKCPSADLDALPVHRQHGVHMVYQVLLHLWVKGHSEAFKPYPYLFGLFAENVHHRLVDVDLFGRAGMSARRLCGFDNLRPGRVRQEVHLDRLAGSLWSIYRRRDAEGVRQVLLVFQRRVAPARGSDFRLASCFSH